MKKLFLCKQTEAECQTGEEGQGLVEYALLFAFIALVVIVIVQLLEPAIGNVFSNLVAQAPVAPPSLLNYTPPPTYTHTPPPDPNATNTPVPTFTPIPTDTPTATNTPVPTDTPTPWPCPITGPYVVPGTVQLENFRCGGAGVAFSDSPATGPGGGTLRPDAGIEGPDLAQGGGGVVYMGWVNASEWVEYQVSAPATTQYTLRLRYASPNNVFPSLRFYVTYDNPPNPPVTAGPFTLSPPPTGGWENWATADVSISLFAGVNRIRVQSNSAATNGNFDNFTILNFVATPTPTAAATYTPVPTNTPLPPTSTPASATFNSIGAHDGRIIADGTGTTGGNTSTSNIVVGDTSSDRQIKGFVSFNTTSIPDNATITSVVLRLYQSSSNGSPYSELGQMEIDIAPNAGWSNNLALQNGDFNAAAGHLSVGVITNGSNNSWVQTNLSPSAYAWINKTGHTQLRMAFETPTNGGGETGVQFHTGSQANPAQLIVTYTVP